MTTTREFDSDIRNITPQAGGLRPETQRYLKERQERREFWKQPAVVTGLMLTAPLLVVFFALVRAPLMFHARKGAFPEAEVQRLGALSLPAAEAVLAEEEWPAEGAWPWRSGKVLIVRKPLDKTMLFSNRKTVVRPALIEAEWSELDSDLRAGSPDEVGTLIQVEWRGKQRYLDVYDLEAGVHVDRIALGALAWPTFTYDGEEMHITEFVERMPERSF